MSDPLQQLRAQLESAQQSPPRLAQSKRQIKLPEPIRPQVDSRGRRRPVLGSQGKARQAQIENAKREMLASAKHELSQKAKEQLKP